MTTAALAALPDVSEPAPAPNRRERRRKSPTRRADTTRFYSPAQLHELTGIPVNTLAVWRHRKYMFDYHRIGGHVLYDREHVEQVLAQHTITANADY